MITSAIFGVFVAIINVVFGLLPDGGELPSGVASFFSWLADTLNAASAIFPVDQLLLAVGVVLAFEVLLLSANFILFIYRLIRG